MEHNKDYMNTHTHGLGLLRVAYTGFKNLNMQDINIRFSFFRNFNLV